MVLEFVLFPYMIQKKIFAHLKLQFNVGSIQIIRGQMALIKGS